jgi:hypothetical protein
MPPQAGASAHPESIASIVITLDNSLTISVLHSSSSLSTTTSKHNFKPSIALIK